MDITAWRRGPAAIALLIVVVGLVAGSCRNQEDDSNIGVGPVRTTRGYSGPLPTTTATPADGQQAASGSFTGTVDLKDKGGDQANFTFVVHAPVLASEAPEAIRHCSTEASRALAIRIDATPLLESSLASTVTMDLGLEATQDLTVARWHSSVPGADGGCAGGISVQWSDLAPQARGNTVKAWVLVENVISPADPTGANVLPELVVDANVAAGPTDIDYLSIHSPTRVIKNCSAPNPIQLAATAQAIGRQCPSDPG